MFYFDCDSSLFVTGTDPVNLNILPPHVSAGEHGNEEQGIGDQREEKEETIQLSQGNSIHPLPMARHFALVWFSSYVSLCSSAMQHGIVLFFLKLCF